MKFINQNLMFLTLLTNVFIINTTYANNDDDNDCDIVIQSVPGVVIMPEGCAGDSESITTQGSFSWEHTGSPVLNIAYDVSINLLNTFGEIPLSSNNAVEILALSGAGLNIDFNNQLESVVTPPITSDILYSLKLHRQSFFYYVYLEWQKSDGTWGLLDNIFPPMLKDFGTTMLSINFERDANGISNIKITSQFPNEVREFSTSDYLGPIATKATHYTGILGASFPLTRGNTLEFIDITASTVFN